MGYLNKKKKHIGSNPIILNTTAKESVGIYIPKGVIYFFLVLLLVGFFVYVFLIGDYFQVKKVVVKGSTNEHVLEYLETFKGKNIFSINNFKMASEIKKIYPQAYNVNVLKGLPNMLKVTTTKRSVVMLWQSDGKVYMVDKMGIVFQEAPGLGEQNNLPLVIDTRNFDVTLGKRLVSWKFIDFVSIVHNNFYPIENIKMTRIEIDETSFHPVLVTEAGWKVFVDVNVPPEDQLNDLKIILDKHRNDIAQYVDLRIPGYGYYK